jgi:hypothetical protein
MIKTAYDYGIFVQLTLFDRTGTDRVGGADPCRNDDCLRWPYNPWNAKNNVNKVINAEVTGVSEFYNRSLKGEIRYRTGVARDRERWPPEPEEPRIIIEEISLGELQDLYVEKVLLSTVEFPNVCYEIMNEPIRGIEGDMPDRIKWANAIVGTIYRYTQGKRFIFYNDFTPGKSGQDVIKWETAKSTLTNYAHLDGVIFHGNLKEFNPDYLNEVIRRDLVIQVSNDTFTGQSMDYNRATATNAFNYHMMFQAEEISEAAADGIGTATPRPTLFNLPPLCAMWIKVSETPASHAPRLFYTQKPDGSMVVFNPDKDAVSMLGGVIQFDSYKLVIWNETMKTVGRNRYTLKNGNQELTLVNGDWTQVFKKYAGPLTPFFYQWEKNSETPATQIARYFLFIYPDNTLITRRIDNFEVNNRARITNVTPTQISIHSDTLNNGPVHVRVGLPGPSPWQAPQSPRREDDGKESGHADGDQRPDEEEVSAGVAKAAGDAHTFPPHVGEGDDQRKEPSEEGDDVPRAPFGKHQRSVQPEDKDGHRSEVCELSRLKPADDVVRQVKRKEEDREQRRDG